MQNTNNNAPALSRRSGIRRTVILVLALTLILGLAVTASAAGIADSNLAKGFKNLVTDASAWLVILCPLVGGGFAVYFAMRRAAADETDGKMWQKRIVTAIVCGVGGALMSGIISIISGYFS